MKGKPIPADEQKIMAEYMAKYPALRGTALAQVMHGDGALRDISEAVLRQRINRNRSERIKTALAEGDGEQIAITGTISREELEALTNKARKYDYLIRAVFAGSTESEKFPGFLYFDYRTVNDLLRSFEPEQYAAIIDNTRRNK